MSKTRLVGWALVLLIVGLAVFAFLGNKTLGLVYIGLMVPAIILHSLLVCARCTNVGCPLNYKGKDFILYKGQFESFKDLGYSDITTLWATVPLALVQIIAFIALWQLSISLFAVFIALFTVTFYLYQKSICTVCTNNCPANSNREYRDWKRQEAAERAGGIGVG